MDKHVYIIAEIGMTHDGSFGQAKALIKAATECGVDAVKIQTHIATAETLATAPAPDYFQDESRYSYFKRTEFDYTQLKELKDYAVVECGIELISSPFSMEAVDLLESVGFQTYKVPSGEITNLPLILELAKTKKNIILSSGMSSWAELDEAVNTFIDNGISQPTLLQCTSEYPCPAKHSGLNLLQEMAHRYGVPVGFSDHTLGIYLPIAAVCFGAVVIEKHFTLSKQMYGPDAGFSLTPDEFTDMVDGIRTVEIALSNNINKDSMASNLGNMKVIFEKSIVAKDNLKKGITIDKTHLAYKKPGDGLKVNQYRFIIGKRLLRDISKDEKIQLSDLADK